MTPAPQRRHRGARRVLAVIGTAAVFLVGMAVGNATADSPSAPQAPAAASTLTTPRPGAPVASSKPTAGTPAPTKRTPATTFGDGTYQVGVDIAAGTYKATVPDDSSGCYWETDRDANGTLESIVANDNVTPGGRAVVTTGSKVKWVKVSGCGTWTKS